MTMSNLKGSNLILNSLGSSCQPIPNKPSFLSFPLCRRKTLLPLPITMSNLKGSNLILNSPLLRSKRTLTSSSSSSSSVFHQSSIETIKLREVLEIIKPLQDLGNPTDRGYYPKLRSYSRTLPRLNSIYKTSDNEVKVDPGCGVNVWVRSYLDYDDDYDEDKKVVYFESNSDCVWIHCVTSILLKGLSGRPLSKLTPDFFKLFIQTLRSTCRESRYIPYLSTSSTESDDFDTLDILQNMLELIQCQCQEAGYVSDYDEYDETKLREVLEIIKPLQDRTKFYPYLHSYSRTLPRLDSIYKTSDNAVKVDPHCGANLWVRAYLDYDYDNDEDKKVVWFEATSNRVRINALASILFKGISGRPLTELTPDFFKLLSQTLKTPHISYRHIFSTELDEFDMLDIMQNMLELIQCQCLILEEAVDVSDYDMDSDDEDEAVECWIKEKLERRFSPVKLEVTEFVKLNFSIVIVSKEFLGKTYAERESMIHSLLKEDDYPRELPPFSVSIIAAKEPV